MCLIVFSWQVVKECPLIVAANRDEFYNRPAAPASWWSEHPTVFAPRDLQAGGTWAGIAKLPNGGYKFAAITNVRDGSQPRPNAPSRGHLVSDYLIGPDTIADYLQHIADKANEYNGFNLLLAEVSESTKEMRWFSNRNSADPKNGQPLTPGIYGISNGTLNSPWPKVSKTKAEMASLLCQNAPREAFFEMLSNKQPAPDSRLPNTGVSLELERLLSSVCIESENYGTRSSVLIEVSDDGVFQYQEKILTPN